MKELEVPFLVPYPQSFVKAGEYGASSNSRNGTIVTMGAYGADETQQAEQSQVPDDTTLASIEEYAPTVARLISGLSPEESLALLQSRVATLERYQDLPLIGFYVRNKIQEYKTRIQALERQAKIARAKQLLELGTWGVGIIGVAGFSILMYKKVFQK